MVKVYKYNNKLAVYLPFDVLEALGIGEGDEIDFFKYNESAYLFAKKSDIANMIMGGGRTQQKPQPVQRQVQGESISEEEIAVLKKLDTLRYQQRTQANVEKMLNQQENETLKQLIKKKAVATFRSERDKSVLYSIQKNIYDRFLMRKKVVQSQPAPQPPPAPEEQYAHLLRIRGNMEDDNIKLLEKQGFVVLQTEAEAATVSAALEESIRRGLVVGTRAFNKKFYIMLRPFIEKCSPIIIKELKGGERKVSDLAEKSKLDENGLRGVLYYLAEIGDVSEKKKDLFRLA